MGPVSRLARSVGLAAACALALAAPAAAHNVPAPGTEVVASGLDNPRGLDLAYGTLLVAEAGRGGSGPCVPGPEMGPVCFGTSGAVTLVSLPLHLQARVLSGLPSLANPDGTRATGPSDVSISRKGIFLTIGLGGPPTTRSLLPPAGQTMGTLQRVRDGQLQQIADLDAFEHANNPDRAQPPEPRIESNPNSVDARGRPIAVADAGGNDILGVTKDGGISVLALLPFGSAPFPAMPSPPPGSPPAGTIIPVDPVPTSVVRGPDGSLYVGQLTGFPFVPGTARVFRIPPGGGTPQVFASGLSFITDLAFGADGSLYVTEFATQPFLMGPGALIRIRPDGTRTELAAGQLVNPLGVVLSRQAAYVSNHGAEPGKGEVVRIPIGD
jgi:hypothetical protein